MCVGGGGGGGGIEVCRGMSVCPNRTLETMGSSAKMIKSASLRTSGRFISFSGCSEVGWTTGGGGGGGGGGEGGGVGAEGREGVRGGVQRPAAGSVLSCCCFLQRIKLRIRPLFRWQLQGIGTVRHIAVEISTQREHRR